MNDLSKEQVEQLSPEQQEAYGKMKLKESERLQELLTEARGFALLSKAAMGLLGLGLMFVVLFGEVPENRSWNTVFPLFCALLFTSLQGALFTRRLDALVELVVDRD